MKLYYYLRVTVGRAYSSPLEKKLEFFITLPQENPVEVDKPLKMEVGIEDCLHIEFQFPKSHYELNDCLVGNVSFKLVKINIKYMEVNIIKRELTGQGTSGKSFSQDIAKYQIMDGCPFKSYFPSFYLKSF